MTGFTIEVLMAYVLGIITSIYMLFGRNEQKKCARIVLKIAIISYLIAIFVDPLLPLPNTPTNLFQSFVVNSIVVSAFFVGYSLNHFLIKKVIEK